MNISTLHPRDNFCSVYNHASLVSRDMLYVVQGNAVYRVGQSASSSSGSVVEGNNPWLRYLSLNNSFTISDVGSHIVTASRDEYRITLPQRANPILWNIQPLNYSDNGARGLAIYSMGLPVGNVSETESGNSIYYSASATTDQTLPDFASFSSPNGAFSIDRPWSDTDRYFASRNTYFDPVGDTGAGYVVGGLVGDTHTSTFLTFSSATSPQWRNGSLPWGTTAGDGAMGSFRINDRLVHVYTGGTVNGENASFDLARIYDSRSNAWYDQPLTGFQDRIPSPRWGSCTAVVAAPDGSSYQMLMYGGAPFGENQSPFSEMWALNIPAFTWVLLDNSPDSGGSHIPGGRLGSTCHIVKGNKLLVFGGSKVTTIETITQDSNCDLDQNAAFFMNLNNNTWLQTFDGRNSDYEVPERVRAVIGGGPTGAATMGQPLDGFADPTLSEILRVPTSTAPATTSTSSDSSSGNSGGGLSTGGIVGIAIGAILIAIGALFFLYRWTRNRKRQRLEGSDPKNPNEKTELPSLPNNLGYEEQRKIYKDHAGNVIPRHELDENHVNPTELPAGVDQDYVGELPTTDTMFPVELPAEIPRAELPDRTSRLPPPPVPPKAPEP